MNSNWYKTALYDNPSSPEESLLEIIRRDKSQTERLTQDTQLSPLFKAIGKERGDTKQLIAVLVAAKKIADQGKEFFNDNLSELRSAIYR